MRNEKSFVHGSLLLNTLHLRLTIGGILIYVEPALINTIPAAVCAVTFFALMSKERLYEMLAKVKLKVI